MCLMTLSQRFFFLNFGSPFRFHVFYKWKRELSKNTSITCINYMYTVNAKRYCIFNGDFAREKSSSRYWASNLWPSDPVVFYCKRIFRTGLGPFSGQMAPVSGQHTWGLSRSCYRNQSKSQYIEDSSVLYHILSPVSPSFELAVKPPISGFVRHPIFPEEWWRQTPSEVPPVFRQVRRLRLLRQERSRASGKEQGA